MSNYINLKAGIAAEIKRALTKTTVEFCAKDMRPMEIISGRGFLRLAQHLVSIGANFGNIEIQTILPHPTTISRNVAKVKEELHQKMFPIVEKAMKDGECSATTDMWTEDYKKRAFITVTVHFFDDNFTLQKKVLFTSHFKYKEKTGKNIRKEILRRFRELGYNKKLLVNVRFVTDKGSNVVKALEHPYTRDDCRAHLLNTVLRNTFESDDVPLIFMKTMIICKNMVRYLKQSGKSSELPHAVKQECETRWNSRLALFNSIADQHSEIKSLLSTAQNDRWEIDLDLLNALIQFLTPFETATKALEADDHPTANKVLIWWAEISEHLDQSSQSNKIKELVEVAKKYFASKFKVTIDTKISCFLDPRYRFLKMLPENERNEVFDEVKRAMKKISISESTEDECCEPPPAKKSRLSIFEDDLNDCDVENEFQLYMKTANYKYLINDDTKKHLIELFWRKNRICFPILSKLVRKRLPVPASSGSSERVFSDAGRYYNPRSSNLKPGLLDDLLFIRNNMPVS